VPELLLWVLSGIFALCIVLCVLCALFSRCPRRRHDARHFFLVLLVAVRSLSAEPLKELATRIEHDEVSCDRCPLHGPQRYRRRRLTSRERGQP
jgi:hypothetical protein